MPKRVSLGRHTDGKYGLRVAPPGYSVDSSNTPLLFDTDKPQLQPIFIIKYSVTAQGEYVNIPAPYGLEGNGFWRAQTVGSINFPYSLPFRPLVILGFDASFNGGDEVFRGCFNSNTRAEVFLEVSTTGLTSTLNFSLPSYDGIDYTPTHTAYIYNRPYG